MRELLATPLIAQRTPKSAARRWSVRVGVIVAAITLMYVAVRQVVPFAPWQWRDILPYYLGSFHREDFDRPGSRWHLELVINEGGAMHSGNYCTWVVVRRWWGRQVVAEGYLSDFGDPVPFRWTGESTFEIDFVTGPRSEVVKTVRVDLND